MERGGQVGGAHGGFAEVAAGIQDQRAEISRDENRRDCYQGRGLAREKAGAIGDQTYRIHSSASGTALRNTEPCRAAEDSSAAADPAANEYSPGPGRTATNHLT